MTILRIDPATIKPDTEGETEDLQEIITGLNKEIVEILIPHICNSIGSNIPTLFQAEKLYEEGNPTKTFYKYASVITGIYEDENQQTFITTAAGHTILLKY